MWEEVTDDPAVLIGHVLSDVLLMLFSVYVILAVDVLMWGFSFTG